ncbi:MAG: alpha/beta fold hydrolase [Candidatus Dormibacteria bacterium]
MRQSTAITETAVAANGLLFDVRTAGPDSGEPVILLHGYPQSAGSWDRVAEHIAGHGRRAIAPHLRGYSPGANPQEVGAYRSDELVADVAGIADSLDAPRFHLAGHDWGGALAWSVAAALPSRVASLTVVSTPHPLAMRDAMRSSTQALRSSYFVFFRLPRVPEALLGAAGMAPLGASLRLFGLPAAAWRRDRERLSRVGLTGPLNWYRAAGLPREASGIAVPTLYVRGRRDWFLGARAAELTARHVTAEYRYVALDAGHWIPDRNAAALGDLLDDHLARHPL